MGEEEATGSGKGGVRGKTGRGGREGGEGGGVDGANCPLVAARADNGRVIWQCAEDSGAGGWTECRNGRVLRCH